MEAVIGAGFTSTQTSARSGNSYHERTLDTRLGQLNLKTEAAETWPAR